ncbi:hypothetical protein GCM10023310_69850 [Paenibacillus vulneris]|uniref:Uncharacterized protein n=1 Tax=Paenibacillus vulneris TaxID=1133364 RepID=A0ABW3UI97_9BACL
MNTRSEAFRKISEFLTSDEKGLLITGTHQYEKHPLVLRAIAQTISTPSTILFRANSMQNLGTIFEARTANYQTGTPYKLGNHKMFIDTINKTSWKNTRYNYDFAVLYPVDPLMRSQKLYNEIIEDLFEDRRISKVFLVSWTDRPEYDYSLLNKYVQKHVVFDALEEDPDYHKRVIER